LDRFAETPSLTSRRIASRTGHTVLFASLIDDIEFNFQESHVYRSARARGYRAPSAFLGAIERYGIDAKLFDWSDEITADCPRMHSKNLYDQCGARCPDLSKVV
jgi:hypothetical protein